MISRPPYRSAGWVDLPNSGQGNGSDISVIMLIEHLLENAVDGSLDNAKHLGTWSDSQQVTGGVRNRA